jgi:ribonucleoside-diphosphate reductase alpha chain
MPNNPFLSPLPALIWDTKYRYRDGGEARDATIEDSWRRVATALAAAEAHEREQWAQRFYAVLEGFQFLPGGRILAGAGSSHQVTLFNCFVMGRIEDSLDGIFDALKEGALTMQQGGGVGYDFSSLRPAGATAQRVGMVASGPVSFMRIWDSMCGTILSTGARRGAMMATLRCDHPDIEHFIRAKQDATQLRHFNLSVLVTDDFMRAVRADREWLLVFPRHARDTHKDVEVVERAWSGSATPQACRVYRRVPARQLWDTIMRATYDYAEPGVIFIDRVNRMNNLWYAEHISATNPCGELPLPPYGACNLGSINLTRFVRHAFTPDARLDLDAIAAVAAVATRMLDNVTDVSRFPLEKQAVMARGARRAPHRSRHDRFGGQPDHARAALRQRAVAGVRQRGHARHLSQCLSHLHRAGAGERPFPAIRPGQLPARRIHPPAAARAA